MTYKLRAECSKDVAVFIEYAHALFTSFKMQKLDGFPDVEFEFETSLSLDDLILCLKTIVDSHVMYQTVNLLQDYTGKRNYYRGIVY
jgi:hypothetical protein